MSNSESVMRCQRRKKLQAVEAFGGKCQICGYDKCIAALDFHHLENKEEKPSYVILRWSWERAKKELEKCILVCSNCHREIHFIEKDLEVQHFTKGPLYEKLDLKIADKNYLKKKYVKPFIKKNCQQCKKDFDTRNKDQKYCCPQCYQLSKRKVKRPTKKQLRHLLEVEKISWTKLGEMFNVSDNAVRKWAKKYEII